MDSRVKFSHQHLPIVEIAKYHQDVESSLKFYFSSHDSSRFATYTSEEVEEELRLRLSENDLSTTFTLLSAVEAAFWIDYLQRSYQRKKDELSRVFRKLHQQKEQKGLRASLGKDILSAWGKHTSVSAKLIGDLRGAFRYRHWLAHGRYWVPKLGQKYDYDSVYKLAQIVFSSFPFMSVR